MTLTVDAGSAGSAWRPGDEVGNRQFLDIGAVRLETGAMQPTLPLLYKILAAAGLEPRIRIEPYDNHDDVLDALAVAYPAKQEQMAQARDQTLAALKRARRCAE